MVQGVGFRPFVWQLAQEFGLRGRVLNDPEGVLIEAAGERVGDFAAAIPARAPKLARVDAVEVSAFDGALPEGFEIAGSRGKGAETRVTPDAATCPDCAAEIRGEGRRGRKGRSTTDERTRHDSAKQETGSAEARAGHATEHENPL